MDSSFELTAIIHTMHIRPMVDFHPDTDLQTDVCANIFSL